jgi:antitoxin MazE
MNKQTDAQNLQTESGWYPPVRREDYDSSAFLTPDEKDALSELLLARRRWSDKIGYEDARLQNRLERLITPLRNALASVDGNECHKDMAIAALLRACGREKCSFWGWDELAWSRVLGASQRQFIEANGNLTLKSIKSISGLYVETYKENNCKKTDMIGRLQGAQDSVLGELFSIPPALKPRLAYLGAPDPPHEYLIFRPQMCILCINERGVIMQPRVQKWGNSLGVRIPLSLARKAGLKEGAPVDLEADDDTLIIRRKQYTLEQLLAQVSPDNVHGEIETGSRAGREAW